MKTIQTIAIIGASGNMGIAIFRGLAKGNYILLLCVNDLRKVKAVANQKIVISFANLCQKTFDGVVQQAI
ncbi:hypothetical protein [uncultured Pontibacter sp.]|uniref:hypothetical protein n=1 Tax=uncultured Pontibacter sp. TaxID=453356 RepID=UPI00260C36B6|nr:hypothetical protein [uncultured Pontibacter sp.]